MNITADILYRELRQFIGMISMLSIWTENGKSDTWYGFVDINKCKSDDQDVLCISMSTGGFAVIDVSMVEDYGIRLYSLGEEDDQIMFDIELSDGSTLTFSTRIKKPFFTEIELPDDYIKYLFHLPFSMKDFNVSERS